MDRMEELVGGENAQEQWFCIQTKPHCEDFASINLFNKQITVFNPKIEDVYLREGRRCNRIAPLFPGYIFAHLVLTDAYYKVKWSPGVKKIVGCGDRPIPVDNPVIQMILDRLDNKEYIKIKRPKLGDKIIVRRGPFNGLIGVFESYCSREERVKVLLELLHQQVKVELDSMVIEKL